MLIELSDRTRDLVVQSLPLMEPRKDALIDRLARHLRGGTREPNQDVELLAVVLTDFLMEQGGDLVRSSALLALDEISLEHSRLRLQGRHYLRFGDALAPAIRDVLGPEVPQEVADAWEKVFWAIIRAVQALETGADGDTRAARPDALSDALHPV